MEVYYVVKRGLKPGIYKTWLECKTAVDGFKNPIFRKFNSFEDANTFYKADISTISTSRPTSRPASRSVSATTPEKIILTNTNSKNSVIPQEEMRKIREMVKHIKHAPFRLDLNYNVAGWNELDDELYIFTDGSSRKRTEEYDNNKCNSGLGVYLGYKCINIKEQYQDRTNNQCELGALDYAFKLIVQYWKELSEMGKIIKIVSDSEYSIKACSVWLNEWKRNNWKTKNGQDVKNRELIESIDASMLQIKSINASLEDNKKIKVKLIHVNSHQIPEFQDKFKYSIWFGNYVADGLSQNTI